MAAPLSRLDQAFEPLAFESQPREREPESEHRRFEFVGGDLVVETGADGTLWHHRICIRHQWASRRVEDVLNALPCPGCAVELEEARGRMRYALLHVRMAG